MPGSSGSRARKSREETTGEILDAAEDLFSRYNPASVTMRQIAEKAGVTHALVHQYLGSKDDILRAVIRRGAPHRQAIIAEHPDFREVVPLLFDDVSARKVHTKSIVRSAMDGVDYAPFEDRLKSGRMLIGLAEESVASMRTRLPAPDAVDPRIVVAAATALSYGWVATQDWLLQICDLEDEDPAVVRRRLREVVSYITELAFPPAQTSGSDEE